MQNNNTVERKVYTVADIQTILGISRAGTYNFIKDKPPFAVVKIGNRYCIPKKSFDSWFESLDKVTTT